MDASTCSATPSERVSAACVSCSGVGGSRRRRRTSRARISRPSDTLRSCSSCLIHCRIFWRARPVCTCASQSREGLACALVSTSIVSPLRSGDTIEVLTSAQAKPSRDWLAHVQTGRARQKIRQWIKQEEQERSVSLGREILAREVRRRRLDPPTPEQLAQAASALSLGVPEQVEASIGRGDVQLGQVLKAMYPNLPSEDQQAH